MASSAVSSVKILRDAAMLRRVLVQEFQHVSPGKLVINLSKRCEKSVMDCAVTHSSRHKKLASIICVKLLTGRPGGN